MQTDSQIHSMSTEQQSWTHSYRRTLRHSNGSIGEPLRFIAGYFRSRKKGCVIKMIKDAGLSPLAERRRMLRLVISYKVVEEEIPSLPSQECITSIWNKRRIKTRDFSDFDHQNPVDKLSCNNYKCFELQTSKTTLFRNSFSNKATLDWNHLQDTLITVPRNSHPSELHI